MQDDEIRDLILEALIASAEAQVRALRRLQRSSRPESTPRKRKSSLDFVEDILRQAGAPLHIQEILARIQQGHGVLLDRESIVSSLTKKVHRKERFVRTAPNTFFVRGGPA